MKTNVCYKGDCYDILQRIPDNSVDLILTDPPYTFTKGGNGGGGMLKSRYSHNQIHSNLGGQKMDIGITSHFLGETIRICKKGMYNAVIFCNESQLYQLIMFAQANNFLYNIIIWHKTNPIPTCRNKYLDDVEFIFQIKEKCGKKILGSYATKSKVFTSQVNKKDKKLFNHPTIKPIELINKFIINHSEENDIILDPFSGSGTTLKSAKDLGRQFIGCEISEEYCEVIRERVGCEIIK